VSKHRFTFKTDTLSKIRPDPMRRFTVWDSSRAGFGLRVAPGGRRVYVLRYRHAGKQHLMALGQFATFDAARDAYDDATKRVRAARVARHEGRAESHPLEERRNNRFGLIATEREALTCQQAVEQFLAMRRQDGVRRAAGKGTAEPGLRESTAALYEGIFVSDFLPFVKGRLLHSLTSVDIRAILDRVNERSPSTADVLRNAIKGLYSWAIRRRLLDAHPAKDLPKYHVSPIRDRTLDTAELAALLKLLDGDAMRSGRLPKLALELSLATGQRTGELLKLEWRTVDFAARVLTIPRGTAKSGKALRVPLSPLALEIVGELLAEKRGRYLFPGDDPSATMQQQAIHKMVTRSAPLMRRHGIKDFRPHDMRRTCRTELSALKVPEMIGEMILGHAVAGKTEARYAHFSFEGEMRDALDKLSTHLCELRGRPAATPNVIPLPVRAIE